MDKRTKVVLRIVLIVILLIGIMVTSVVYIFTHWVERNIVTDIEDYETYFSAQGIHRTRDPSKLKKTSESYLVIDNIFPGKLPESAEVEDFHYEYYNSWDPCYLSYLVYSCDENDYKAETERLKQIPRPVDYLIYGATDFPYPLLAVKAGYNGYIYALTDEAQQKIIYVELTFCNYFTDIDYENVIPQTYLPLGFNAKVGNPTQEKGKLENADTDCQGNTNPNYSLMDRYASLDELQQAYNMEVSSNTSVSSESTEEKVYYLAENNSLGLSLVEIQVRESYFNCIYEDGTSISTNRYEDGPAALESIVLRNPDTFTMKQSGEYEYFYAVDEEYHYYLWLYDGTYINSNVPIGAGISIEDIVPNLKLLLLRGCASEKPVETNSAETAETSQNETSAESNAQPGEQKVTDKEDGDWEYWIKDGDSYEQLIAAAREYIIKHDDQIRMEYDFSTALMSSGTYEIPGYLIEDIDGNGTDELIFGENGNNPDDTWDDMLDGVVYEIYTTYNGKPVRVLKGWERNRYYFCENGMIANEGSSGAGNSSYAYFTFEGSRLHLVEAVIYDGMKDADHPWFYSTESEYDAENAEPISEERGIEIREKYVYEHPVFIPFAEENLTG